MGMDRGNRTDGVFLSSGDALALLPAEAGAGTRLRCHRDVALGKKRRRIRGDARPRRQAIFGTNGFQNRRRVGRAGWRHPMNDSFGPWSTAMSTGADVQLSTFWKRRMTMLPELSRSASRTSRRALLLIALAAAALLTLPTLYWGPAAKSVTADDKVAAGQGDKKSGDPETATNATKTPPIVEYL